MSSLSMLDLNAVGCVQDMLSSAVKLAHNEICHKKAVTVQVS